MIGSVADPTNSPSYSPLALMCPTTCFPRKNVVRITKSSMNVSRQLVKSNSLKKLISILAKIPTDRAGLNRAYISRKFDMYT